MMHQLFRYSVLLAGLAAVPAAGSSASPSCPGDKAMANDHPGVTVSTSGSGHNRVILQTDPDGTIRLDQHGKDHSAMAVQSGAGGSLAIDQSGASASADVVQDGACNAASLKQAGSGNTATIVQSGGSNRAVVRQGPAKGDAQ